jgi:hypothetical protein
MKLEHTTPLDLETKAVVDDGNHWTVTGYASTFGNKDLGGDVVVEGAFKKSLEKHGLPMLLWNHKMDDVPLGNIVAAREDKKGLWFKAELPKDDTFVSGRIIPQVKRKGLKGVSIGYKAIDRETRKSDGARLLKQINLVEISFVPRPMNPLAEIESVKSLDEFDPMRALEGVFAEMQRLTRG